MAVSELPGNPNAVWTVKRNTDGKSGGSCSNQLVALAIVSTFYLLINGEIWLRSGNGGGL